MKRLLGRQTVAYGLGLLTAGAGFAAGSAWAGHAAAPGTISACQRHESGTLYIPTKETKYACKKHDTAVAWSITGPAGPQGLKGDKGDKGDPGANGAAGPQGQPGTITNAKSPNGVFTVTLSNAGILLKGPNGKVVVDFSGAHVISLTGAATP
jgi:hypothetical protein